jgi:hypothetical protein
MKRLKFNILKVENLKRKHPFEKSKNHLKLIE